MYCSPADIKQWLPEAVIIDLTDDAGVGTVDESKVNDAIAAADAEIDGYCSVVYRLPFETVPAIIKKYSVDIAIYNLYSRYAETIPDTRQTRYDNIIKALERIMSGKVRLGDIAEDPQPAGRNQILVAPAATPFTDDSLKRF